MSPADKWNALRFTARLDFLGQNGFSLQYAARKDAWQFISENFANVMGDEPEMVQ